MSIKQAFVLVNKESSFVRLGVSVTHTGEHITTEAVDDIETATVFNHPNFNMEGPRVRRHLESIRAVFVPVEITRTVVLKGYGVKS